VSGQGIVERMVVTNVEMQEINNTTKQVLSLKRSNDTIDGDSIQSDVTALAKQPVINDTGTWFCPLEWYAQPKP
jgi:hypothetical protein